MRRFAIALLLAACTQEPGEFPAGTPPGGHINGGALTPADGGFLRDAGDAGATSRVAGTLCQVSDIRLRDCIPLASSGLTVTIKETGASTTAADDGTFVLPASADLGVVTLFTPTNDGTFFGAVVAAAPGDNAVALPVLSRDLVETLFAANGLVMPPGAALVIVHVDGGGVPLAGATLSVLGGASPFYDSADPVVLSPDGPTGQAGTAVYFDVAPGTPSGRVTFEGNSEDFTVTTISGAVTSVSVSF